MPMPVLDAPPPLLADRLNPEQAAAVAHDPAAGPLVVVAGAGTGKTMTLAARVAQAVAVRGVDPARILLVTFSRRAAGEMERRVGRLLHESLGLAPRMPAPRLPWCGTFHAIAARLLREEASRIGLAAGFTVLDRGDAEDLMGLVRQDLGLASGKGARFPLAGTCLAIHSRAVNGGLALEPLLEQAYPWCRPLAGELARLFEAFGAVKRAQHSLDFDDLLLAWWHLLDEPAMRERIRARFAEVLVDEAQDCNRLQAEIVERLAPGGHGVTLVGDDAQAIYAFRGGSPRHLLSVARQPGASVVALTRNYRSTMPILAASNAVIERAAERFPKALWTDRHAAPRPRLLTVADESEEARGVADAVLAARESGLALRRQAVLFRSAGHSAALELELARRRIPFVKYGGLRFLESAHVKDVLALLRWADNPQSALSAWRVARLVPGIGPASARRLAERPAALEAYTAPPAAAAGWRTLTALLAHLRGDEAAWPDDFARAVAWYRPHLERLHDDARIRALDLQQLGEVAARQPSRERFLTELALDPPSASSDESGEPGLDEDYLVLSTIHSAKGQEWNAVHVLRVVDGCLPADLATGSAAEVEEERRLLYVAMTRAKDELTLWVPQRFYVTQQRTWGDRHLYALRSRFIDDTMLPLFDAAPCAAGPAPAGEPGGAASPEAGMPAPGPSASPAGPAARPGSEAPVLDLLARLHGVR